MPEATITIADLQAPAQGKKMFTAFDTQGGRWQIWPDKANLYAVGGTYSIEYQSSNFKGTTYNTISKLLGSLGGSSQAPAQARLAAPQYGIGSGAQIRTPAPAAPQQSYGRDDNTRLDIYCCGLLNNMMANPNVLPMALHESDITNFINMIKAAWLKTLKSPDTTTHRATRPNNDLNDEIPI